MVYMSIARYQCCRQYPQLTSLHSPTSHTHTRIFCAGALEDFISVGARNERMGWVARWCKHLDGFSLTETGCGSRSFPGSSGAPAAVWPQRSCRLTHRLPRALAQGAVSHPWGFSWGRGFDVLCCLWWWWEDWVHLQHPAAVVGLLGGTGLLWFALVGFGWGVWVHTSQGCQR